MGRKRWAGAVSRQNRYYMRDRYLFFGSALMCLLLFLYVLSARVLEWIPEPDIGRMLPYKEMRIALVLAAFCFGVESEKKYYLVRTRIQDPLYENEYVQSHLNAMHILRMHAFDFGVFHRQLFLRRLPAAAVFVAGAALFASCLPGDIYVSNVTAYAVLVFVMIQAGAEIWFRVQLHMLNRRSFVSVEEGASDRIVDTAVFIVEGLVWCWFFMLVGSLFSNTVILHANVLKLFSTSLKRRENPAFGWLIAAFIIHTQAHIKGEKQLRRQRLLVGVILIADLLFFLQI
ncbi:MAG: hypothetical protein IK125_07095 [Lachnospiraceae bacterium]|nr:hypothetical protein [Lachnospiraceae bacterium]